VTRIGRTKCFILVSLLTMAVVLASSSIISSAPAQDQGTPFDPQLPPNEPAWMSQLTDEQKAELQQLLDSLRESGATPEEIRDTINAKLEEWGIEIPEPSDQQRPEPPWMSQLTDGQKAELQQLLDSLRESGATPEETREAMNAKLQEWGIELPALSQGREPPWMSQLTDEQKAELQQLLDSLKASGASPEETRDAIDTKLQEWGIEVPVQDGQQHPEPPWMGQLSDEQKAELQQLVESLRESGATPQQIRDAVNAKLEEWGIEIPTPPQSSGQ